MSNNKQAICPDCGSPMWKIGTRVQNKRQDRKQVYRCKVCRRATGNPIFIDVPIAKDRTR